ncbi:MAG: HEAT repeat domain-containing protein [Acidobacteria bacterium]|nr:HEAT repeat domain-containing protein [Acidobacteriota bacterium]MBS1865199.1 HEAT repeat domain-containing protein [Acidobacteriota bacterium]
MNYAQRKFCSAFVLSCIIGGYISPGFCQTSDPESSAVIERIMANALSRCYSTENGVKKITFEPATSQEFTEVKALGQKAVAPLARYLNLETKNGLTQLFAVKFLMAIGGSSTLGPLKRAFGQDQWEVTRAAALSGIFGVSPAEAKPYVDAALGDESKLVRQRAQDLHSLYGKQVGQK